MRRKRLSSPLPQKIGLVFDCADQDTFCVVEMGTAVPVGLDISDLSPIRPVKHFIPFLDIFGL